MRTPSNLLPMTFRQTLCLIAIFACVGTAAAQRPSVPSGSLLQIESSGQWSTGIRGRLDNRELRIFSTTVPTKHRLPTLMHDPIYRLSVVWQNVGYNQPAHPGFCLERAVAQKR